MNFFKKFSHEAICGLTRNAHPHSVLLRWTWAVIHMHFIWTIFTSLSILYTQEIYVISDASYQLNFFEYFYISAAFLITATIIDYTFLEIKIVPTKSHTMKLICHWFLQCQWSEIYTKWSMRDLCWNTTITWQTPGAFLLYCHINFPRRLLRHMSSLVPLLLLCLP